MKKNVLVFPCGSVAAIDIYYALKDNLLVNVSGASSRSDHGEFVYKKYFGDLPNINDLNFINEFNRIIVDNNIDYIIPTHDTVAYFLVKNHHLISARVLAADLFTTTLCRYKHKTYNFFKDETFCPLMFSSSNSVSQFPVFLKPSDGQGAQNTFLINNIDELYKHEFDDNWVLTEYLPGDELSVDCFTNYKGELIFIGPRTRERILAGVSVRSRNVEISEEIASIARKINSKLNFNGYWFFQIKRNIDNEYKLLEISTRFAGTYVVNRQLDINFPLLSILNSDGVDIEIAPNNYSLICDRTITNKYNININYDYIYIDLDDTLIFNKKIVNSFLMMYLYQCKNKNKKIYLITKHDSNVLNTLRECKIEPSLFDCIIHITDNTPKYNYINESEVIFIDNSFYERLMVKRNLGIPTFDVSNVESLIDWKECFFN